MSHRHVSIDQYAYLSRMRDYNCELKMAFAVFTVVFVVAINSNAVSIMTLLFMSYLIVKKGKVKLNDYIRLLGIPLAFIILSSIAIMINFGEASQETLVNIPFFATRLFITRANLQLAVKTALKALGAISALYMMTLSTPMGEILCVMRKIHIPEIIVELMHLIYRYIFILFEISHQQKLAATSRLGYQSYKTSIRSFGASMANLFVLSMKKANEYYDAMESRGYNGAGAFYCEKNPIKKQQLVEIAIYIALLVVILLCKCIR